MPHDSVVDNDVLIKSACYGLLGDLSAALGGPTTIGVLGSAKYVVRSRLRSDAEILDAAKALTHFDDFLAHFDEITPTRIERDLAVSIEDAALTASLPLDSGESQLCAVVILREIPRLFTGDKNAIRSIELVYPVVPGMSEIVFKVVCIEQLFSRFVTSLGHAAVRILVCSEPGVDIALSVCFECTGTLDDPAFRAEGLSSYINHLRSEAPHVLHPLEIVP